MSNTAVTVKIGEDEIIHLSHCKIATSKGSVP